MAEQERPADTLHGLLDRAAERWPERVAVSFRGTTLTYRELRARVRARARVWLRAGVGVGDRVGLALPRSVAQIEAVYAISACGAAYVPFDLAAPAARLAVLAEVGRLRAIVADSRTALTLGGSSTSLAAAGLASLLWLDVEPLAPTTEQEEQPLPTVGADHVSYVLFTSGSTGTPKGVVHTHRSALAFAHWAATAVGLGPDDRVAGHAGLHFDLSTFDLFASCAAGATLCPVPEAVTFHGAHQVRFLVRERLTVWYSVPLAWIRMLATPQVGELADATLRTVIFAGEVFPLEDLRALHAAVPKARLLNFYGPTETNVCTWHEVSAEDLAPGRVVPVPIGRAAAGAVLRVGDAGSDRGELHVSGPTVMWGYLGGEALATEYATGDLVEVLPGGELRFLGRRDRQVKIRGHRVEPGDVECVLAALPNVSEATVVAAATGRGERELVAHVAPADLDIERLKAALRTALPPWMVPSRVVAHASLPRSGNGKIDANALGAVAATMCYEPADDG